MSHAGMPEKNIRLREIMRPVASVTPDVKTREALGIMLENDTPIVVVVDSEGNLEGVVTDALLLDSAVPNYVRQIATMPTLPEGSDSWVGYLTEAAEKPVREVMSREVSQVELGKSEVMVAHRMVHDGVPSVVVTDKGKVAGVVGRLDLYKAIVDAG